MNMNNKFKPLLACEVPLEQVKLPVYVSTKLDGIRCVIIDGVAYSRSLKPIRNKYIQSIIGNAKYNGFDGELVVGDIYAKDVFQKSTSGVMSEQGEPDFVFYVFDDFTNSDLPYSERADVMRYKVDTLTDRIKFLGQKLVHTVDDIKLVLGKEQSLGGEGLILRNPDGVYKFGRSTPKQQLSIKVKFFEQNEFEIVGFEERYTNTNEATINELGYTSRSSHKDNLVPTNTLGSLVLKCGDTTFKCGTGFDDALRKEIWDNKEKYLGKLASIRYMSVGSKNGIPRVPSFVGWRDSDDMS